MLPSEKKDLIGGEGKKEGALSPKRYNLIIEIDEKNQNFTHYMEKVVYDVDKFTLVRFRMPVYFELIDYVKKFVTNC